MVLVSVSSYSEMAVDPIWKCSVGKKTAGLRSQGQDGCDWQTRVDPSVSTGAITSTICASSADRSLDFGDQILEMDFSSNFQAGLPKSLAVLGRASGLH